MSIDPLANYSYDTYLQLEQESDEKYEYHDGMITNMAGGTPNHGLIMMNAAFALNSELKDKSKPCVIYSSEVKVRIESSKRTFYPDFSVVCGPPIYSKTDPLAITNPILIVEVLSESNVGFDRGEKFTHYRQLTSLQQYVLIDQKDTVVDTFYRNEEGLWEIDTQNGLEAVATLKAIGCELPLKEVYYRVPGIDPAVDES
ncbi:MAG: Uma2 family endonuclease [Bacteroidota bacterium]